MTIYTVTTQEKLDEIERLITEEKRHTGNRNATLIAVAADLRGRLDGAPSAAMFELERRINVARLRKEHRAVDRVDKAMLSVAEELLGRWPTVKQALERFGAEIET